ncbi:MAG TPA: hypothetical protein PLL69_12725, partial [Gemmatimonadales bacterium]|nr:hypothetical protein [Gemmatimonadales bacterium]
IDNNPPLFNNGVRNDPFSPRKLLLLLSNPEAIREALLFKSGAGLRGDHFSLLLLGEQRPESDRGITVPTSGRPILDWRVTDLERRAYSTALERFLADVGMELRDSRVIPADRWGYRTAAHHSGGAATFLARGGDPVTVAELPGVDVCDGSMLLAGGIANSGLTLAALALRLAEDLEKGRREKGEGRT